MTTYTESYREQEEQRDESSMTFLEHLDELRTRLIRCAVFILVAFVVCWAFSDKIYHFLEVPVRAAMLEAKREAARALTGATVSPLEDLQDGAITDFSFPRDCTVGDALVQAGTTIRVKVQRAADGSIQLVTAAPWIINTQSVVKEGYVIPPDLYSPGAVLESPEAKLVVPTVQGAFNLYIKVAFYAAIFFAVPFILVQAWGFISPGLYPHEKKYALPFIFMASIFFLLGVAFAYYIAFPRAANFLLGIAAGGNLRPLVTADDYFDLILTIMLGLGLVFEIPTVTYFLARLGLVTPRLLLKVWRYAVILIFILAAVLSPTTDIPNLLVFAAPMLMLYFFSVGIAWVFYKKRQPEESF
jgi:sec-independent protein translocase protein TatC